MNFKIHRISMSVKSSVVMCLSNTVVKVRHNYLERTLNIAVIKYFGNDQARSRVFFGAGAFLKI